MLQRVRLWDLCVGYSRLGCKGRVHPTRQQSLSCLRSSHRSPCTSRTIMIPHLLPRPVPANRIRALASSPRSPSLPHFQLSHPNHVQINGHPLPLVLLISQEIDGRSQLHQRPPFVAAQPPIPALTSPHRAPHRRRQLLTIRLPLRHHRFRFRELSRVNRLHQVPAAAGSQTPSRFRAR